MTASQRFNVGYLFLYGTLWEEPDRKEHDRHRNFDSRVPAFVSGITDWHARCVALPTVSKQTEVWSGDIQTTQIDFQLADTDGGASATLYASSTSPLGKPVALYMKMSDNPTYWSALFTGNVVRASKRKGLITLTVEDTARNLLNSQFVTDYQCIATNIDGILYGTIKDIIGTNLYVDDKFEESYITVSHGADTDWTTSIAAVGIPAVIGLVSGPAGAIVGAVGGLLGLFASPSVQKWTETYLKIKDYNVIPDGIIAGGQNFKFSPGSVSAYANGTSGPLYYLPTTKSKGGHFENGIRGTIELDDILHTARKGDYVYVEQPVMYWGSPDDIIQNMLTGSNVTVRYTYPTDFSDEWISQTSPLKHIECYANVDNFEAGGIAEAISKLAEEFGFSFFIDENNKFAVRAVRDISLLATGIIGTLSEDWNVINDGITSTEDLQDNYTDLEFQYKDLFLGKTYEQTLVATMGAATYYGGLKRVKTIQSRWIHDALTGQFIAKRMARRYATSSQKIECDVTLYSGPFKLGEVVRGNGWAIGSNRMCEIISYSKDLGNSKCSIVAEDAESIYSGKSYFYLQRGTGAVTATSRAGFGTILATVNTAAGYYGFMTLLDFTIPWPIGWTQTEISISVNSANLANIPNLVGSYFRLGTITEEVMKCISAEYLGYATTGFYRYNLKVERGALDTVVGSYAFDGNLYGVSPWSTCFNIGTVYGNFFRWF